MSIYVNGNILNVTLFPDNTSQVWHVPQIEIADTNWVNIVWDFSHEGEFMHLAQFKALLDQKAFRSTLRLNYLPYGRQDKPVSNENTFALQTFAHLLNCLHFEEVIITDPHSKHALDLINNSIAEYPEKELQLVLYDTGCGMICYPDKGAVEKYSKVYPWVYICGEKTRNQTTGEIMHYEFLEEYWSKVKNERILIVDDICDGGSTFKMLAHSLLYHGASGVDLFVTHGLFTKGLKTLKESGINRIFTKKGEASEVQNHITYRKL